MSSNDCEKHVKINVYVQFYWLTNCMNSRLSCENDTCSRCICGQRRPRSDCASRAFAVLHRIIGFCRIDPYIFCIIQSFAGYSGFLLIAYAENCPFSWRGILKHNENTPIKIYRKFYHQNNENFQIKNSDIFLISAQNIDCGYSLEPPRRGGSNEYPQSMF